MVCKFFDKTSIGSGVTALADKSAFNNERLWTWLRNNYLKNYTSQLFKRLKPITLHYAFKDNIWVLIYLISINKEA